MYLGRDAGVRFIKEIPESLLIFPAAPATEILLLLQLGAVPGFLELHHLLLHSDKTFDTSYLVSPA